MSIDDFARYSKVLHAMTVDFARAVPDDKWEFSPDPPEKPGRTPAPHRLGQGFAPFSKQLRHVVCVRGVYNDALTSRKVDWTRKHEHYRGLLTRDALLSALDEKQYELLAVLKRVDVNATIDLGRNAFHVRHRHMGVRAARGDSPRAMEHVRLARRVRHAIELAEVVGLVRHRRWRRLG